MDLPFQRLRSLKENLFRRFRGGDFLKVHFGFSFAKNLTSRTHISLRMIAQ
jgi:hypothetical protein